MDHPINFVRTPGSFTGKAPTRYDKPGAPRRRCRCGAVISPYTKGAWCDLCSRTPDRKAHYTRAPKEHVMEPATIKASAAAKQLGVTGKELKQLERDGRIEPHTRGRGLFGHTFLADDVDRLQRELEGGRVVAEAARDLDPVREPEPEFQIDQVTPEPDDEPEADEPLECCGQKNEGDDCFGPGCARGDEPDAEGMDEGPTDAAESFEAYARRRGMEFAEHYGKHLMHVDLAREAAADFRTNIELAQDYARNALRVQEELEKAGARVEGIFAPPPYAVGFDLDRYDDEGDPEIRAMYLIRSALEGLDREAQIRVVRWATAKFGIDKPLPKPQVLDLSSDAAADAAHTSPV